MDRNDKERGRLMFEKADDLIHDVYEETLDPRLAEAIMEMCQAFFLVFPEASVKV